MPRFNFEMSGYPNNSGYYERLLKYGSVTGVSRDIANFEKMCRLCMFESEDRNNIDSFIQVDMADTIGTAFSNKQSISFILKNVLGLPISTFRDKEMPQQICRKCIVRIGELYALQIQCHKINYLYKELNHLMKTYFTDCNGANNSEDVDENFEVEYLDDNVQAYEVVETFDKYQSEIDMTDIKSPKEEMEIERPFTPDYPEIIECCFCKQTFETRKARKKHLKHVHPGVQYASCMLCPRIFSTRSSCSRHMLKFHGENTRKVCQICFKVKLNRKDMKMHLETHKKKPNRSIIENKDLAEETNVTGNMNDKVEGSVVLIEEALASILDTSTGPNEDSENENFTELSDKAYQCPNLQCRNNYKTNVTFLSNNRIDGLLVECLNCNLKYPIKTCVFDVEPEAYVTSIVENDEEKGFEKHLNELAVIKKNDNDED